MCASSSLGATHICINKHNAIDTKKKVAFMSIISTKTYEVGETLVCEGNLVMDIRQSCCQPSSKAAVT